MAKPSKPGHMFITNSGISQSLRKGMKVELRIMARPWYRPHIDDHLDPVGIEKINKILQ